MAAPVDEENYLYRVPVGDVDVSGGIPWPAPGPEVGMMGGPAPAPEPVVEGALAPVLDAPEPPPSLLVWYYYTWMMQWWMLTRSPHDMQ